MGIQIDDFDYLNEEKKVEEKIEEKKVEEKIEEKKVEEKIEEKNQSNHFFAVKIGVGKENACMEMITHRIKNKKLSIYSIIRPHGVRGYLFIESEDKENAEEACYNLPYVKGIIPKELSLEEIKPMIEPQIKEIKIEKGDVVEIIAEPFKKEKAKVIRVDKTKEEVVVSLLEAVIPIPVTIKIDNVKVIRRDEEG